MIVPMKKVSLVVIDRYREGSLKKLREIGVVHLERKFVSSDALSKLLDRKARTENVIGILRSNEADFKAANKGSKSGGKNPPAVNPPAGKDLVLHVLELSEERKTLSERASVLTKEKIRLEEWGGFNPKDLELLEKNGLVLRLYEFTVKAFESLPSDIPYIVISRSKTTVRAVVPDREVPGETAFDPGDHSLSEINGFIADIHNKTAKIDKELVSLVACIPLVESELKTLLHQIEFETANTDMESLEEAPAEYAVSWLTGFVPSDELGRLKRAAAENSWALLADDPGDEDAVPTKLKNNRFVSLLNPLTNFLNITPGYNEVDVSGWFLLFFTIYFGMIFGDAAYGAILIIASFFGIFKTMKKGVPAVLKLALLLGVSNFIWGALTCTWFGIDADKLPMVLQNISLPLISSAAAAMSAQNEGLVRQNLMIFCFSLALVQLCIGHIIAITKCRTLKVLGDVGSIGMLVGMYGIVLALIASNEYRQIPLLPACTYVLGGGFFLNFVFVNYDGSIGRSILESLKNFIAMFLGVANVFGDIMSYIRLWAVGLAGAAIASTVVSMAGPMLGNLVFFVFGIILLVFGHGLNLVLNALSVLVHGVRLNTLEFSGHVGLTWSGTAYKPFSEAGMKPAVEASK